MKRFEQFETRELKIIKEAINLTLSAYLRDFIAEKLMEEIQEELKSRGVK